MFEFDERGNLSGGVIITATCQQVEQAFVINQHRANLWAVFTTFRNELRALGAPVLSIWLDGSYLSRKTTPNDIDIVIFVESRFLDDNFNRLAQFRQQFAPTLHIFWSGQLLTGTPTAAAINELERMKWFELFSEVKGAGTKSFVELTDW